MKLHDPDTEKDLIRIARKIAGAEGFQKSDAGFWIGLLRKALAYVAIIYVAAIFLSPIFDKDTSASIRHAVCAILIMSLARLGVGHIALAFSKCGFFSTLSNLPISGRTALSHIRGMIFKRFLFPALLGSFFIAIYLHFPVGWMESPGFLTSWGLLTTMVWATLGISQTQWVQRLRIVKIWQWVAYFLITYFVITYLLGGGLVMPSSYRVAMEGFIGRVTWIFPPVWVFPEKLANGGSIAAAIWVAWGLWAWMRWPSTAFPGYDKPHDFFGAFGDVGKTEQAETPPQEEEATIPLDPPPRPPSNAWVDRLIYSTMMKEDLAAAGAFMPATNYTRRVALVVIFAALWLLVLGIGKSHLQQISNKPLVILISWAVPAIVFALGLLPAADPLKGAILPFAVGNTPVPLFTGLPVSLRSLLRLTFRITIIRTIIAVTIATPFFWAIAKIHQFPEVGFGILSTIPAIGIAWILSVPAALCNRLDSHLRRRKGIFPLILATSLAQVPIGFLWIIASIAGIFNSAFWASDGRDHQHAIFLLPVAFVCLAFGGIMSRLLFEILHLSIRQRRYDWKSKIK